MARAPFKAGDLVEIVTVDRGRGDTSYKLKAGHARGERWRAVILMPSPLHSGWWVVKKYSRNGKATRTYTVPAAEMVHASK